MPEIKTPSIDPLFGKPHDYISGIVEMDPEKVKRLKQLNSKQSSTSPNRVSKRGLRTAIAATAVGAGLLLTSNINNSIDESDKKSRITFEEDVLSSSEKTVLQGQIVFNSGVNIRRYPAVVEPDEYNEGNLAFSIGEGQKLIIDDPVAVSVNPEETWFAFTMNKGGPEGKDPLTLWVKNDVLNQTSDDGAPYAQLGLEGLYDSGLGETVSVDNYGFMTVAGNAVSIGHIEN